MSGSQGSAPKSSGSWFRVSGVKFTVALSSRPRAANRSFGPEGGMLLFGSLSTVCKSVETVQQ